MNDIERKAGNHEAFVNPYYQDPPGLVWLKSNGTRLPVDGFLKNAAEELTPSERASIHPLLRFWDEERGSPRIAAPVKIITFPRTPIAHQGSDRRTCVCFAILSAMGLRHLRKTSIYPVLSAQYANWSIVRKDDPPRLWCCDGVRLIDAMSRLSESGVCLEHFCPYEDSLKNMIAGREPSLQARQQARYRILDYCLIDDLGHRGPSIKNPEYLENILAQRFDIVMSFESAFMSPPTDGVYTPSPSNNPGMATSPGEGAHAVVVVGYDRSGPVPYFICKNSYGVEMDHDGYLYLSYDYVRTYAYYGAVVLDVGDSATV